jgi:dynactin complex subunit
VPGRVSTGLSASAGASAAASQPRVGDRVTFRGNVAFVRFIGSTGFAGGQWAGLEMTEGSEGIHDGMSSVDKRRYYTCPRGRGVFVRPSQLAVQAAAAAAEAATATSPAPAVAAS